MSGSTHAHGPSQQQYRSAPRPASGAHQPTAASLPVAVRAAMAAVPDGRSMGVRTPKAYNKEGYASSEDTPHTCLRLTRIPTPSDAEIGGGGRLAGGMQGLTNQREGPTAARRRSIRNSTLPRPHPFCATDRTSLGNWRRRSQSPDGPRKAQRLEPKRCAAHVRAYRMSWCLEAQAAGSRVTG